MKKKIYLLLIIIVFLFIPVRKSKAFSNNLGMVNTKGYNLNIRQSDSTSSKIITKIYDKSYIEILDYKNNFYKIKYENITGYAHKDYISVLNPKKAITLSNLNLRKSNSSNSKIILTIPSSSQIYLIDTSSNYYYVNYNGYTGYAHKDYISNYYELDVVSFKQFDSRWKNIKIGSKTIGQIGCLTTSISMSESYRLNKTITPDIMKSKLSYTANSDMYWPVNYSFYNKNDYLYKISKLLEQNIPVIFGSKNNKSSHFIIIKGYNNKGLDPKNFIINDPGYNNSYTLSDHLKRYPNFYKIAYYK